MKNRPARSVGKEKMIVIFALYLASAAIMALGFSFGVYCVWNDIKFQLLTSHVPGVVFGAAVLFLGVRYVLSVRRLKKEVYKPTSKFSWRNFRKKQSKL